MKNLIPFIRKEPPAEYCAPQSMLESSLFKFDRQADYLTNVRTTKEAQHRQLAEDLRVIAVIEEGNEFVRNKLARLTETEPRAYLAAE